MYTFRWYNNNNVLTDAISCYQSPPSYQTACRQTCICATIIIGITLMSFWCIHIITDDTILLNTHSMRAAWERANVNKKLYCFLFSESTMKYCPIKHKLRKLGYKEGKIAFFSHLIIWALWKYMHAVLHCTKEYPLLILGCIIYKNQKICIFLE